MIDIRLNCCSCLRNVFLSLSNDDRHDEIHIFELRHLLLASVLLALCSCIMALCTVFSRFDAVVIARLVFVHHGLALIMFFYEGKLRGLFLLVEY